MVRFCSKRSTPLPSQQLPNLVAAAARTCWICGGFKQHANCARLKKKFQSRGFAILTLSGSLSSSSSSSRRSLFDPSPGLADWLTGQNSWLVYFTVTFCTSKHLESLLHPSSCAHWYAAWWWYWNGNKLYFPILKTQPPPNSNVKCEQTTTTTTMQCRRNAAALVVYKQTVFAPQALL